jgi:hypothetical protein
MQNARRSLLLFVVLLALPSRLLCQAEPLDAESAVRQILTHANGGYNSTDEKELGWLGDASAVALTKIIGGKAIEEGDIGPMLLVVTLSYSAPRIVKIESDREPRATLFLLHSLDLSTTDTRLKEKIYATRRYVRDQYARFVKDAEGASTKSH